MASKRGLDSDLGGFAIAHFANHDDVRVLAQDRAQGVGKAQPNLRVNLDLVDAFKLVLNRLFNGDNLEGVGIEFRERGVEGGGFARTGRAGDQQDAVRARQQTVELLQVIACKTNRLEAEAHVRTIKHAHDDALAMHGGHGGDTQVKLAAFDAYFDAPVLRQTPLGNVEVRHEFDAGVDRSAMLGRDNFGDVNDAVHPITYMQAVVKGLQVDVRCAQVNHAANDLIDHTDDGRFTGEVLEMFNKITAIGLEGRGFISDTHFVACRQRPVNIGFDGNAGVHLQAGGQLDGFEDESIVGHGHGHSKTGFIQTQGIDMVAA